MVLAPLGLLLLLVQRTMGSLTCVTIYICRHSPNVSISLQATLKISYQSSNLIFVRYYWSPLNQFDLHFYVIYPSDNGRPRYVSPILNFTSYQCYKRLSKIFSKYSKHVKNHETDFHLNTQHPQGKYYKIVDETHGTHPTFFFFVIRFVSKSILKTIFVRSSKMSPNPY